MKMLGIDYGDRFIGLAYKADDVNVVVPFGEIERNTDEELVQKLRELFQKEGIGQVVIGMPHHVSGQPSEQSVKTALFIKKLQVAIEIDVKTIPEALTSKEAKEIDYPQASIHEKSAMLILQDWLESNK